MFELNIEEFQNLKRQFGTSRSESVKTNWGGTRYLPMVFTEQGVAMLSSILNSKNAILVNIQIIRVFTKMRKLLETHKEILKKLEEIQKKDIEQDNKIILIFNYLKQLEQSKQEQFEQSGRKRIGYKLDNS